MNAAQPACIRCCGARGFTPYLMNSISRGLIVQSHQESVSARTSVMFISSAKVRSTPQLHFASTCKLHLFWFRHARRGTVQVSHASAACFSCIEEHW